VAIDIGLVIRIRRSEMSEIKSHARTINNVEEKVIVKERKQKPKPKSMLSPVSACAPFAFPASWTTKQRKEATGQQTLFILVFISMLSEGEISGILVLHRPCA
jgi:hypothetical protein